MEVIKGSKIGKPFIVLDVEGMSTARPYNIGYIVCDKFGNVFAKRSFALPSCIWENLQNCFNAQEMTHKNIQEILQDYEKPIEDRKYHYKTVEEAKRQILKDITGFRVKEIWAYNCTFDKSSLSRLFADDFYILDNLVKFYDIIPAIVHTKLLNKNYIDFCKKNNFITEKGNIMTKAEIVYRYLKNNLTFVEEHTGLSDVFIEYEILLNAIQSNKKIERDVKTPAWKIFKKFCEIEGISIID